MKYLLAAVLILPCALAHATARLPLPEELARIICEFASQEQIERRSTQEVCSAIRTKFPQLPQDFCQEALDKAWYDVEAKCALGPPHLQVPSPEDIEKFVCEFAKKKVFEEEGIESACHWLSENFPSLKFQPNCRTVLKEVWETATAMCPREKATLPTPEDIERMACEVATKNQVEEQSTEEVCEAIAAKFQGVPKTLCVEMLRKAWDEVVKQCPKGAVKLPTPEEIERMVCEVATQKQVEEQYTEEVCQAVAALFQGVPEEQCKEVLKRVWDEVAKLCPAGKLPTPEEIERMACEVATQRQVEEQSTEEVCEAIAAKFQGVPKTLCEEMLRKAWDEVVKQCPKSAGRLPTPEEFEHMVCEVATKKMVEEVDTHVICKLIEVHFQVPEAFCQPMLEKVWDKVAKHCPKPAQELSAIESPATTSPGPLPEKLEELICKFAGDRDFEDFSAKEVCKAIASKFPEKKFPEEQCAEVLEATWDSLIARCPPRALPPTPADIKKAACDAVKQHPEAEGLATSFLCQVVEEKFPTIHFQPDCMTVMKNIWEKLDAEFCSDSSESGMEAVYV